MSFGLMGISEGELIGIRQWASRTVSVREVWLFGNSGATSSAEMGGNIDLAIALMPPIGKHDWALWAFFNHRHAWRRELFAITGRRVSLAGLWPDAPEDKQVRDTGILLWTRAGCQRP